MKDAVILLGLTKCFVLFILYFSHDVYACGSVTHTEISYRALYNYQDDHGGVNFDSIARQNQDALEAGSAFPDSFYPSICFGGDYHSVSEDTHWTPWINASIHYIRNHYPQPWDENTKKLVAFLLGSVSHAVADISWHSLGIKEGFIQAMSKTNFHDVYPTAHTNADLGGDVLNTFQLNLNYSDYAKDWYVPVNDLLQIYDEYYGKRVIGKEVIESCTKLLFLVRFAERLLVKKLFPILAQRSLFLVDQLYDYFLGGIDDMTFWTKRIWKHVTEMIEHGESGCHLDHNPLFIRCNNSGPLKKSLTPKHSLWSGFYIDPATVGLSEEDVIVERSERGVTLRAGKKLKEKLRLLEKSPVLPKSERSKMVTTNNYEAKEVKNGVCLPDGILTVKTKYAKLGQSYAVADLDNDGNEDVVIGSPGFYSSSGQQSGMVFILFGTDNGLDTSRENIYESAEIKIPGPESEHSTHTQFGMSVAVMDLDMDGQLDLVVGAPSHGSANLTYTGAVYVYTVNKRTNVSLKGIFFCEEVYCNIGSTLAAGTTNSYHDLLVGSPFAPGNGEQKGIVANLKASKKFRGRDGFELTLQQSGDFIYGSQNYSWFGNSMDVNSLGGNVTFLAVGEPNFRKCAWQNCSYNQADVQAKGRVHVFQVQDSTIKLLHQHEGDMPFAMFGSSVAMGRPYGSSSNILAVAATGRGVTGHIFHVPTKFDQVGSVLLFNLSSSDPFSKPIAVFNGDRQYGRFGASIKFADLNRDGVDDLIIGAPLRTEDFTGELIGAQEGQVYVFFGGHKFPRGDATSDCGLLDDIEPCPGKKASRVLNYGEEFARFGSKITAVRSKKKVNLLITAPHSSFGERLSGAIAVFNF